MNNDTTEQGVLFKQLLNKPVSVRFDQSHSSSDGGMMLLKGCDERLGLSERLAGCVHDARQSVKVRHSLVELLRYRVFAIAAGYADGNDAARLSSDPVFKLLSDRDPVTGDRLASQSTLSRFDHTPDRGELLRLSEALAEAVIERHRQRLGARVRRITIDLDPTHDPTHGAQQLTFFNAVYDTWCYLPLAGFLTLDGEAQQYLFCYALRAGNAPAKQGCLAMLKRVLPRLRRAFPKAKVRIRLDAGFAGPELYRFFETHHMEYVVCMSKNDTLKRFAEPLMATVRAMTRDDHTPLYGEAEYQARSWKRERRVIIRADIAHHPGRKPKDNPRFLITNLTQTPKYIYEKIYCARGDMENRIKELKHGLEIDRTSCTTFNANQFRVLLTAAACVLMQELRLAAQGTDCANAQITTLRIRLLKLAAWFESSVRRIVVHLPTTAPWADEWRRIARSIGAVST